MGQSAASPHRPPRSAVRVHGGRWLLFCAAALCVLAPAPGAPREAIDGEPLVTRLLPDLELYEQHFAIAETAQGIIHLASHAGVLSFDGSAWRLLRLPNGDVARALADDGAGRIYVGGVDLFGYVERDAAGGEHFHEIGALAGVDPERRAGDVWQIVVAPQGVFFRALQHVFRYDPATGALESWFHEERFGAMAVFQDEVLLQFRGLGLMRWTGEGWAPAPGGEGLASHAWALVGLDDEALLALSADGRWREYRDGAVRLRRMPPGFPRSSELSDGLRMDDGAVVFAGARGELHVYHPGSGDWWRFRVDQGDLVALARAADGALLIAGDDTAFRLRWPAPWSVLGPEQGWSGSLNKVVRWGSRWLALTGSGAGVLARGEDGRPEFRREPWTDAAVWDLLPLSEREALIADTYGVLLVSGTTARRITTDDVYPRTLYRSPHDGELVYVGADNGVLALRRSRGRWHVVHDGRQTHGAEIASLVERARGELWLGSARGGVQRLHLSADRGQLIEARRWDVADGIVYGDPAEAQIAEIDGELLATTSRGIFRWTGERFESTDLDGLTALLREDEMVSLVQGADGLRWAYSFNRIYRERVPGAWRQERPAGYRHGMLQTLQLLDDGSAVISAARGILRFDPRHLVGDAPPPAVVMRGVGLRSAEGTALALAMPASGPLRLPMSKDALTLHYSLPDREDGASVRYQTQLLGLEQSPSEWSPAAVASYSGLPPGRYRFIVRARDSQGRESWIEPVDIEIMTPWYATQPVRVLWGLLVLAIAVLIAGSLVRWRTGQLRMRARRLEAMVVERTAELELANRRLDELAHLDGLTEIANRRRLDSYLEYVWERSAQLQLPVSLLAIDLDHFKAYNDRHGHLAGDELLRTVANTLAACLRKDNDLVARFGGDEFMAILPGVAAADALGIARRMRERVEALATGVTVSIGLSERWPEPGTAVQTLLEAADRAVYSAKARGRNRVVAEDPDAATGIA